MPELQTNIHCADISHKFNQHVTPTPTDVINEEGKRVISLRAWLTQKGVHEDPTDPRWIFLNDFHELFQSFNRKIRATMQEAYGLSPEEQVEASCKERISKTVEKLMRRRICNRQLGKNYLQCYTPE